MEKPKKHLNRRELDALVLSTPQARHSYEEALLVYRVRKRLRKAKSNGIDRKT